MARHERRASLRFRHWDAVERPKPNRPGIDNDILYGRYEIFYGSTFKQRRQPPSSFVADPSGDAAQEEQDLARCLGRAIDERTYFHGSLMSEANVDDPEIRPCTGKCPNDVLLALEEVGQLRIRAFVRAWAETNWLGPDVRAELLNALWWKSNFDVRTELALSLLICDRWCLDEIAEFSLCEVPDDDTVVVSGHSTCLLPRTAALTRVVWNEIGGGSLVELSIHAELEQPWHDLMSRMDVKRAKRCPKWSQVVVQRGRRA